MRSFFWIAFLSIIFSSCDKIAKTESMITGVWDLVEYKYTAPTGLIYFLTSDGAIDFGSCGDHVCNYSIRINYQNNGGNYTKYEHGKINFADEHSFTLERKNPNGTTTLITYGSILLITKDDLKLEFSDEYGLHEFVLQK